ncbi:cilia- and flagella-associated protein 99 isoform X2 [Nilaparvata lugens]|uniref:cilia- and flagella-associated protein 99 isoform X2 n=1 Tax=Nilaparvata lugens TaxID=108931 RepID=UPI00193D34FD|nr:cilia- and flagella-associated protein 99 isoform X2 [Nilaparvata lugens]XP_039283182.1 cilia- and flagella-associated protein 99 isoform X2 [Nilaparvata lugens]XP_039283183.1 cilia- and flagella-associated protein 99 isoform X2 [Nilaparvata lugens]
MDDPNSEKPDEYDSIEVNFLKIARHLDFLEDVVSDFYVKLKRKDHTDKFLLIVLFYIAVFWRCGDEIVSLQDYLKSINLNKSFQIAKYLSYDKTIITLTEIANRYFDLDYVTNEILLNVFQDGDYYKKLHDGLYEEQNTLISSTKCVKVTRPQKMEVLNHTKRVPKVPCNSREEYTFKATPIPENLHTEYKRIEESLNEAKRRNREEAEARYFTESQKFPISQQVPRDSSLEKNEASEVVETSFTTIKSKPAPKFQEPAVPVKKTTTCILREAALIAKKEEKEIERLKKLLEGAADFTVFESFYDGMKCKDEKEKMLDIEKKHLKGLLTYEEAIQAKKNLTKVNKIKRMEFEREREKIEAQLREYKEKEMESIKQQVERVQQIQQAAEEKKQVLVEEKQKNARELNEKTRALMIQLIKQQQDELNKKMVMIKEIRLLQSLRIIPKKDFDATETMNMGLFCEMSYLELTERLALLREEMKEQLEQRQLRIKQEKIRQQEMLKEMETLIDVTHHERKLSREQAQKTLSRPKKIIEEDKELMDLRKRLEATRRKRFEKE